MIDSAWFWREFVITFFSVQVKPGKYLFDWTLTLFFQFHNFVGENDTAATFKHTMMLDAGAGYFLFEKIVSNFRLNINGHFKHSSRNSSCQVQYTTYNKKSIPLPNIISLPKKDYRQQSFLFQ